MIDNIIPYPAKDEILVVRKSLIDICEGDVKASILLSYLLYWYKIKIMQNKKNERLNKVAQMHGDVPTQDTSELQYHTDLEIYKETFGLLPKKQLSRLKKKLIELGFITLHKNPNPKYAFDRTTFYKVEIENIKKSIESLPQNGGSNTRDYYREN